MRSDVRSELWRGDERRHETSTRLEPRLCLLHLSRPVGIRPALRAIALAP
jgi:hypothetical protein